MKKFYSSLAALFIGVAAMAQNGAPLYYAGDVNGQGWKPAQAKEFTWDGTNYVLEVTSGQSFKISTVKADWDSGFNGSALYASTSIQSGQNYTLTKNAGPNNVLAHDGKWTIKVSGDLSTLTATAESQQVGYTKVYLRGGMNGWGANDAWQFETTDGETYMLKNVSIASGVTFKVADANWGTVNYGGQKGMEVNTPYVLSYNSKDDCTTAADFTGDIEFVLSTATITLKGEEVVVLPESMYVIGNVNGLGWGANNVVAMDNEGDGIFSISEVAIGGEMGTEFGYFSFCEKEGATATDWSGVGTRYGAENADEAPEFDADGLAELALVRAAEPNSFKVPMGKYNMTFNYEDMTLSIEKIEEVVIEPVTSEGAIAAGAAGWKQTGTPQGATEVFAPAGSYAITYNADKTLTFVLTLDETCVGLVPQLFINGVYVKNLEVLARDGGSWTATTDTTYELGETVPFSFYCAYAGGLSETNAMSYVVGSQTGIDAVEAVADAPVEYYTIQGVKVAGKLANGLYIAKQGNKVTKILVK
ncbi:MAG: hypothetical protein NC117_10325 [Pseudoflavonifractor sp.]|nr:hypothetical protein [Pseudoflavonifractor sp.]